MQENGFKIIKVARAFHSRDFAIQTINKSKAEIL